MMMKSKFHAPTDYYCQSLIPIDEKICALLAERKKISENNPGFPHPDMIATWCHQYGLNEDLVRSIFASLYYENRFFPQVEPSGFLKFVPVLKSVEIEGILYAVTHIKQYKNASVVFFEVEAVKDDLNFGLERVHFELAISPEYACRNYGGGGNDKRMHHSCVVTPPLPDDVSGLEFSINIKPLENVVRHQTITQKELTVTIK